jgi:hypothetical protein
MTNRLKLHLLWRRALVGPRKSGRRSTSGLALRIAELALSGTSSNHPGFVDTLP